MRLWRFTNPGDVEYAVAVRIGTWQPKRTRVCPSCGASRQRRVSPLVIEWARGSCRIGDFTWPGFDDEILVTERVIAMLRKHFVGIEPGEVITRANRPAPRLFELRVRRWVYIDRHRSTVRLAERCEVCGQSRYELHGAASRHGRPRQGGMGLYIRAAELANNHFFRVRELPAWVFCTDRVRKFVEQHRFTNVGFLEVGELSNAGIDVHSGPAK